MHENTTPRTKTERQMRQIQSSIQPEKIEKQANELNCHEGSAQDEEFVART